MNKINLKPHPTACAKRGTLGCLRMAGLLAGLLSMGSLALAQTQSCSSNRTRPNDRYVAVTGAQPAGSEVRDTVTGLIWRRCLVGMSWNSATSNCTGAATAFEWKNALNVPTTASRSAVPGATAWRIPNAKELASLVETSCRFPAINIFWFPDYSQSAYANYMTYSSSPSVYIQDNQVAILAVDFSIGVLVNRNTDPLVGASFVRLVRSAQ